VSSDKSPKNLIISQATYLKDHLNPFTVGLFRFSIMLAMSLPVAIYKKSDLFPSKYRKLLVLRGVSGTVNVCVRFFALHHMPLADVAMINASTSLFVTIHARIFLKEPIQRVNVLNILVVMVGLALIVGQPFSDTERYTSNPLALASALALTFSVTVINPIAPISLRKLKSLSSFVILANLGGIGTVFHVIAVAAYDRQQLVSVFQDYNDSPKYTEALWLLIGAGVIGFFGQQLFVLIYKVESASVGNPHYE